MSPSDEERIIAFLVKPGIAYRDYFVAQETFKLDRQRQPEGQARSHARRVGFHRKVEQPPEFRKVIDEGHDVGHRHVVEACDETDVVDPANDRSRRLACAMGRPAASDQGARSRDYLGKAGE
jgi:hypothetical protein